VIRKPKTYTQRIASRFCHICSRMPRKGQRSIVCCNMQKGLCRKIVCERCISEQDWVFPAGKDAAAWLCPHCAGACPARSQCIIYSRINARRKRIGEVDTTADDSATLMTWSPCADATVYNSSPSPQSAFDSTLLLLAPYSFLLGRSQLETDATAGL
jgi:hypothetical protein